MGAVVGSMGAIVGSMEAVGLAKFVVDLGANRFPDTSMSCPVGFMYVRSLGDV
jgi:hypothetical protein